MKKQLFYLLAIIIAGSFFACSDGDAESNSYDFSLKFNPEYGTVVNIDTPLLIGITVDSLDTSTEANYITKLYTSSPSSSEIIVDSKQVVSTETLDHNYIQDNTLYFTFQASKIGKYTITAEVNNEKQKKKATIEINVTADLILTLKCDEEKGTVTGAGTYPKGTTIQLKAEPKEGYKFVSWVVGKEVYSNLEECTLVISNHLEMEAVFEANTYPFSGTTNIEYATVKGGSGKYGEEAVISVSLSTEWAKIYEFDGWYKNGVKLSGDLFYKFVVGLTNTFEARFEKRVYLVLNGTKGSVYTSRNCKINGQNPFKSLTANAELMTYEYAEDIGRNPDPTDTYYYLLKRVTTGLNTPIEVSFDIEFTTTDNNCNQSVTTEKRTVSLAKNQIYIPEFEVFNNTLSDKHYYKVRFINSKITPDKFNGNRTITVKEYSSYIGRESGRD